MEHLTLQSHIEVAQLDELAEGDRELVDMAVEATQRSYAPYSNFHVGAALRLANGETFIGCNQENAAFPAGICAERSALFAAGAQFPDVPVVTLAITARGRDGQLIDEPASPCGTCRQVLIETETRFRHPVRILLHGRQHTYIMDSIKQLMPLSFTEF